MRRIYRVAPGSATPSPVCIADAARELAAGALALLPTETVYGVGVSVKAFSGDMSADVVMPGEGSGYRRIFTLKRRELTQTVPWLVADASALDAYGRDVAPEARVLAERFWPGALTIVVRASEAVPAFLQAADGTVALRASASPVIGALARACGPLAVTSANTHGLPAPASFAAVEPRVLEGVDIAIDAGETTCRDASTIVSFVHGELEILREGAISAADIRAALDSAARSAAASS